MASVEETFRVANQFLSLFAHENRVVLSSDGTQRPFSVPNDSPILRTDRLPKRQLMEAMNASRDGFFAGKLAVRHLAYCDQGMEPTLVAVGEPLPEGNDESSMYGLFIGTNVLNQAIHAAFGRDGDPGDYVVLEETWRIDVTTSATRASSAGETAFTNAFGRFTW